jgi:hypothetical protein
VANFLYLAEFKRLSHEGTFPIGLLKSHRIEITEAGKLFPLSDECRVIVVSADADIQWQTDAEEVEEKDCRVLYARQEKTYLIQGKAFAFFAKQ